MELGTGVLWIGGGILLVVIVLIVMVVVMNGRGRGDTP
jgi:ABC-type lipoprotein release transport system permease subunit